MLSLKKYNRNICFKVKNSQHAVLSIIFHRLLDNQIIFFQRTPTWFLVKSKY